MPGSVVEDAVDGLARHSVFDAELLLSDPALGVARSDLVDLAPIEGGYVRAGVLARSQHFGVVKVHAPLVVALVMNVQMMRKGAIGFLPGSTERCCLLIITANQRSMVAICLSDAGCGHPIPLCRDSLVAAIQPHDLTCQH